MVLTRLASRICYLAALAVGRNIRNQRAGSEHSMRKLLNYT